MNTEERIKEILKEFGCDNELDDQILKLELENLVVQVQLEQLQKDKL